MGHFCNKIVNKLIYIAIFILFTSCNSNQDDVDLLIFSDNKMELPDYNEAFFTNLKATGFNTLLLDENLLNKEDDINNFLDRIYQYKIKVLLRVSLDNIEIRRLVSYPIDGIVIDEMGYSTALQQRYKVIQNIFLEASKNYPPRLREPYLNVVLASANLSNANDLSKVIYEQKDLHFIDNRISQIFTYLKHYQLEQFLRELKAYYSLINKHSYGQQSIKTFDYIADYNKDPLLMKRAVAIWSNLSGSLLFINQLEEVFFDDYGSFFTKSYLKQLLKSRASNLTFKKAVFGDKNLVLQIKNGSDERLALLNFAYKPWSFKAKAKNGTLWYNMDKTSQNIYAVDKTITYKVDGNDSVVFIKK